MTQGFTIVDNGSITKPQGFKAGGLHCGIKKTKRHDIGAILCEHPAAAAAVYTKNLVQAAPIKVTKDSLIQDGKLQAVVVNSGNANACTGQQGFHDALQMRSETAAAFHLKEHHVAVSSTGVIGELMPMEKLSQGIAQLPDNMKPDGDMDFAQAILTTDLVEKQICVKLQVEGREVVIGGTAKGSGMIHPNMATMLGFITTDAVIETPELQQLLSEVTERSFNMITVDGDTSTNDMALAMASGMAGHRALHPGHLDWVKFSEAFQFVAEFLAKKIARDGEGATKLIEVHVSGATSEPSARAIVKTVIGSSLVKSAVFGADANWGRIIAAAGRAGEPLDPETVDIRIGDIQVLEQSRPVPFDEELAEAYLKKQELIQIYIDLHVGEGSATGWGCDLTYEYVRINAAYRT